MASSEISQKTVSEFFKKPIVYLVLTLVLYFGFGLSNITHYLTADEHFWLPYGEDRVRDYWKALAEGDWEDTQINDKPGVTIALLSGIAVPFSGEAIKDQFTLDAGTIKIYNTEAMQRILFFFRFPLLLFNGFFIFYFFWILKKITKDPWISVWACGFILLSPVILGISQIVNPDTLFWTFGAAAILTFYAYLQGRKKKLMWLTLLLFGLTLLSKYVGIIFIPFLLLMIIIKSLFHLEPDRAEFSRMIRKDLFAYAAILLGGTALFAIVMPAAIADPEVLYESTIGFPGMLPVFLASAGAAAFAWLDSFFLGSAVTWNILKFFSSKKVFLEKALYLALSASAVFVVLNWMSRNSFIDLSYIPFDAKTKKSFTTDNPYLIRYIVEWVPLLFALTPTALFLLLLSWAQGVFGSIRHRAFLFTLSIFFLIFYVAVIEQGLLVTTRYSIILFPLASILAAFALRSLFSPKSPKEQFFVRFALPFLVLLLLTFSAIVFTHEYASTGIKIIIENVIGNNRIALPVGIIAIAALIVWAARKWLSRIKLPQVAPALLSIALLAAGAVSLVRAFPHYFIYTNSLLPHRYLLFHSWGYGGYEAAQYLNQKPNAKDLTIWVDNYGVCEFFVGQCIKKQKLKPEEYSQIDYMVRSLHGTIRPDFPFALHGGPEWFYAVGGRSKNFIKISKTE